MLVSLKTINNYVNISDLKAEDIANSLTFAGIEVEEVIPLAVGTNLVIGEIIECEKHPDSDHLHILKVDLGRKYGIEQIVCGASNARKGLKVIVARVGAKLPGGEIKKGCIRGIESNGMCCSLLELGVDSKYLSEYQCNGIEELEKSAPIGEENVLSYLGIDDTVLNLKVLANRPDLLSIFNVAREIGAIYKREVNIPEFQDVSDFSSSFVGNSLTDKCKQFSLKEVRDIKVGQSPAWLKNCLMAMGIRSINNIVDIGNYIMLMTGQPIHMYDMDKLSKKELVVKDDLAGDFTALDGKNYSLINGDIVITSGGKVMCLGGIMGASECAVDENSKNIIIESASFDGASIRHTSNRLGLGSESSSRFVKGTNHFQSEYVLSFAAKLCKEICLAKSFSEIISFSSEEKTEIKILSSKEKINSRLGTKFTLEEITSTLSSLSFKINSLDNDNFEAIVPSFRLDVTGSADLSEEVIRLLGYHNVVSTLPILETKVGSLTLTQSRLKTIRNFLLSSGLDECLTYSLISKKEFGRFNLLNDEEPYKIINPLSDDHEVFRTHILHSLLKVASYNVARQNKNLALFETGFMQSKVSRKTHLAVVLLGNQLLQDNMNKVGYDFYHMKGLLDSLFSILGIEGSRFKYEKYSHKGNELHPGKSAYVYFQNKVIGAFGELHPNAINDYDLGKNPVVVLEIDLTDLLEAKVSTNKMSPISKFPCVSRDLAFVVNKDIAVKDIIKAIKVAGKGLVEDANVFDVYNGEHVEEGKKSVAISLIYRKQDATLTEKEVNDAEEKIKFDLTRLFQAELRS